MNERFQPRLWKVQCLEDNYPGMWQRWFKYQCVAVGWPPPDYRLHGGSDGRRSWSQARNAILNVQKGDFVIAALQGHKVGRIGEVIGKSIEDGEWDPLVPPGPDIPDGEMGRRLLVRWDLASAPDDMGLVVQLPEDARFTTGELRPAIQQIYSRTVAELVEIMRDPANWISLLGNFGYEKALSDYIAAYPQNLEDGLLPHPDGKIRERVFDDRSRLDVLLIDRDGHPVIVECKQHAPTISSVEQIRHYVRRMEEESGQIARAILVHGGPRKLHPDVRKSAAERPSVEIIRYRLDVDFAPSV